MNIPKPGGGERQLGIPTVTDRLVQQAILQVLTPILDPTFSDSSFGFRPGRSAHDALERARSHVADERYIVVDLDLEKFFDHVNHDVLMNRLGRHVRDKRVREITRRNRGVSIERMVSELNRFLLGWCAYYRHISGPSILNKLDGWVRRKLRCVKLKQCKRARGMARFLMRQGISKDRAYSLGGSGKGWWRLSCTPQAHKAMAKDWFEPIGLVSLAMRYHELKR